MSDSPRDSDGHHAGNCTDPGQDPDQSAASRSLEKRIAVGAFHPPDSTKAVIGCFRQYALSPVNVAFTVIFGAVYRSVLHKPNRRLTLPELMIDV